MTATPANAILLRGASVVDGTGAPAFISDVLIEGDRITAVGVDLEVQGATVVDLDGLTLTPGFIDTHTHDDFAVILYPEMGFKVLGGVTTCVIGNCGMGAAPHRPATRVAESFHPGAVLPEWDGYAGYLSYLDEQPPSVNVAALMGHNTIRVAAMGGSRDVPNPEQLAAMRAHLQEGMDAGCLGVSTGLIYETGKHSLTAELIDIATTVAADGGIYTTHMRDEGDNLERSIDEVIEIATSSGAPAVISHLKVSGRRNWGSAAKALEQIATARASGLKLDVDQYPYTAGSTVLSAIINTGLFRSKDIDGTDFVIASCPNQPEWNGRTMASIGDELGMTIAETADHVVATDLRTNLIMHLMSEDDVQTILGSDGVMIGSDGLPTLEGHPHPRLYGTFARVLGHYSREVGVLDLPAAVHRMTQKPAEVFGLGDRGVIREGAIADLVAFDPDTIIDAGTFDDPHQSPDGISNVWVAGVAVVSDASHTGNRPGRVIRRQPEAS